jgi:hypothetical protein
MAAMQHLRLVILLLIVIVISSPHLERLGLGLRLGDEIRPVAECLAFLAAAW